MIPNRYPLLCQPPELEKLNVFITWDIQHSSSPLLPSGCVWVSRYQKTRSRTLSSKFFLPVFASSSPSISLTCCSIPSYFTLVHRGISVVSDAFARVNMKWFCLSSLSFLLFAIILLCCYNDQLQNISRIEVPFSLWLCILTSLMYL